MPLISFIFTLLMCSASDPPFVMQEQLTSRCSQQVEDLDGRTRYSSPRRYFSNRIWFTIQFSFHVNVQQKPRELHLRVTTRSTSTSTSSASSSSSMNEGQPIQENLLAITGRSPTHICGFFFLVAAKVRTDGLGPLNPAARRCSGCGPAHAQRPPARRWRPLACRTRAPKRTHRRPSGSAAVAAVAQARVELGRLRDERQKLVRQAATKARPRPLAHDRGVWQRRQRRALPTLYTLGLIFDMGPDVGFGVLDPNAVHHALHHVARAAQPAQFFFCPALQCSCDLWSCTHDTSR